MYRANSVTDGFARHQKGDCGFYASLRMTSWCWAQVESVSHGLFGKHVEWKGCYQAITPAPYQAIWGDRENSIRVASKRQGSAIHREREAKEADE